MSVKINIICNCSTCKECVWRGTDKVCLSSISGNGEVSNSAKDWLSKNKMSDEEADDCPCWRLGIEILPENSWYECLKS